MARLEFTGTDGLQNALTRISEIPWPVTEQALDGMAKVAAEEIRKTGEAMGVRDEESNVHILDHITTKKAKQTDDGGREQITFDGTRRRGKNRHAMQKLPLSTSTERKGRVQDRSSELRLSKKKQQFRSQA